MGRDFLKEFKTIEGIVSNKMPYLSTLNKDAFKTLIGCIISTRTKDETTHEACRRLFSKYPTARSMLKAPLKDIRALIYPVGFYRTKAKYIKEASRDIVERFRGRIPSNKKELLKIKGVGSKCANLVLSEIFSRPEVCVDTHVHRITNRLGWVNTKDVLSTEISLKKVFPSDILGRINKNLVIFGKKICRPLRPLCRECALNKVCKFFRRR